MDDRHSVEFLLSRLDLIDIRLRQLEEKQREPENYFAADLRARGKPMPSSMDDARLKRNLMNRLRLLETRIRQLSQELEKGGGSAGASSSSPSAKQKQIVPSGGGRGGGGAWRAGAEIFHGHWPKKKAKDDMQVATTEAMEQRTALLCGDEQRRMERARLHRRWFPVGC